jgi:hypothetical protein
MAAKTERHEPTITGDASVDSVRVNTKGGSYSAILKQPLRQGLGGAGHWFGAKMEFEPDISCVLMAPGRLGGPADSGRKFRITRVSPHRFVIDLDDNNGAVIDPVIKSVLSVLEELAKAKKLTIESADDMQAALDESLAKAERRIANAGKKSRPSAHR